MLADRCDAYYEGKHYEASAVASIVHNLVYDHGRKSQFLLGQLDLKDHTTFLDSRSRNSLTIATMRGIWPITRTPHTQYTNENRVSFNEWWEKQEFIVKFSDISFTRAELGGLVRNQEGGGHVAPYSHEKLAIIQRTPSRCKSIKEDNDDGTTTAGVMFSISGALSSSGDDEEELNEFVTSICLRNWRGALVLTDARAR